MSVLPLFQFKEVKARENGRDPMKFMCLTPAHPRLLLVEGGVTQTSSAQDEEKTSLNLKLYTPNPRTARPAEASTETQEKDAHGTAESPNSSDAADWNLQNGQTSSLLPRLQASILKAKISNHRALCRSLLTGLESAQVICPSLLASKWKSADDCITSISSVSLALEWLVADIRSMGKSCHALMAQHSGVGCLPASSLTAKQNKYQLVISGRLILD